MNNNEPINYGHHYWYVRVTKNIAENEEQYVQADEVQVKDGVLLFLQNKDQGTKINMAFAPGTWLTTFVTSYKTQEN
ncbi:MAG: hypothetical protein MGG11_18480 [Trichodesmium sp. MAG_R03]|nr:hypothetical protein [Trichodesmium sp. MAG_R03]